MEWASRHDRGAPRSAERGWGWDWSGCLVPAFLLLLIGMGVPIGAAKASEDIVDKRYKTLILNGFRRYHSVCNHCHGPDGLGSSFGPSLVDEIPDEDAFKQVVIEGVKGPSGVMKGFADNRDVMQHLDAIYAYIAGRASGDIARGRPR